MRCQRQPGVEDLIATEGFTQLVGRLIPYRDGTHRFCRGGDGNGDHPCVLTMCAGHPHHRLGIGLRDQVEPAVGQALATLGTLKATRLAPQDVEQIHAGYLPRGGPAEAEADSVGTAIGGNG
jgi:hypothetical protein